MEILKLEEGDISLIAQQLVNITPWNELDYQQKSLERYLKNDEGLFDCYKIIESDSIAGIICIKEPWWKGVYIELFAVFPEFQKKGIGHKVILWLQKRAGQSDLKNIWLLVSDFNHSAYQFYLNNGFSKVGELEGLLKTEYSELLLRKRLDIGML